MSDSSRLIVKADFGERLPTGAGAEYSVSRATMSDASVLASLSALGSKGRTGTLVRTEQNIAARLRDEAWSSSGSAWGTWGACPWVVRRQADGCAVAFFVLRDNASGPHSPLVLGPLAASAPSWNADNIGRGVPATDRAVTLEEVAVASPSVLPAVARYVSDMAVSYNAGRVECSLALDDPCARFLAHIGPAIGEALPQLQKSLACFRRLALLHV